MVIVLASIFIWMKKRRIEVTYTFGRQLPYGYYAYLNRKGTLIIGKQTFDAPRDINTDKVTYEES